MPLATIAVAHRNDLKVVAEPYPKRDQKDRIIEALGSGRQIPRVDDKTLSRYYKYLSEHLCFPFLAHYPQTDDFPGRQGVPLHVLELSTRRNTWATGLTASSARPAKENTRSTCR